MGLRLGGFEKMLSKSMLITGFGTGGCVSGDGISPKKSIVGNGFVAG